MIIIPPSLHSRLRGRDVTIGSTIISVPPVVIIDVDQQVGNLSCFCLCRKAFIYWGLIIFLHQLSPRRNNSRSTETSSSGLQFDAPPFCTAPIYVRNRFYYNACAHLPTSHVTGYKAKAVSCSWCCVGGSRMIAVGFTAYSRCYQTSTER